jgi:outer membrane protein TolC
MPMWFKKPYLYIFLFLFLSIGALAQERLSLQRAVELGIENYGTVKAKQQYAAASKALVKETKLEYYPNLNIGVQQDYGTVNGQNGPAYSFGVLPVSSSGAALATQNWNAAFGGLYLANVNWDFFAFGRAKERIETAKAIAHRDEQDWQQELFKQKIRVSAAYLNLVAARQLTVSYQKNLERADTLRRVIRIKAMHGLVAGVDSTQANAEYSSAQILLTKAIDFEQTQATELIQLMGVPPADYALDSYFVSRIPTISADTTIIADHPVLQWYRSRIAASDEQARYLQKFAYPTFSVAGVMQSRASGFGSNYNLNQTDFKTDYFTGVSPSRFNYLFGVGASWNFMQPFRTHQLVKAQRFTSAGLQSEYELAAQQTRDQLLLSEQKITNAMNNYRESGVQVKAANEAYVQKTVLYKNGLTTLVDLTQTLYILTRAETDRDIAYSNVWQALVLKAAAMGDYGIIAQQL